MSIDFTHLDWDNRRKLIATSYYGFKAQLKEGEVLILEFDGEEGQDYLILSSDKDHRTIIESIEGTDIFGYWAVFKANKPLYRAHPVHEDSSYPIKTTIHRGVEDLALAAIAEGKSVEPILQLRYEYVGPHALTAFEQKGENAWEKIRHTDRTRRTKLTTRERLNRWGESQWGSSEDRPQSSVR